MTEKYRIGVFGGSFDPVHKGHTGLAEFILGKELVDKIIFLPSACSPHKQNANESFAHRLKMLEVAVGNYPDMEVSPIEAELSQPSYTVNSLRALTCNLPKAELFFILGADSLVDLSNWYKYREILTLAHLIIAARPGISGQQCLRAIRELPGNFPVNHDSNLWSRGNGRLTLCYLSDFIMPYSSTHIRRKLGEGIFPQGLGRDVFSYIKQHDLYKMGSQRVRC